MDASTGRIQNYPAESVCRRPPVTTSGICGPACSAASVAPPQALADDEIIVGSGGFGVFLQRQR